MENLPFPPKRAMEIDLWHLNAASGVLVFGAKSRYAWLLPILLG